VVTRQTRGKSAPPPAGTGDWLENELRETKARVHKAEADLAQALKQTYALDAELRKVAQALSVTASVESAVHGFREELRQARDQMSRIQDRQAQISSRMEQIQNQRQADLGRERQDLGLAVKQVDAMNKVIEGYDTRVKALEEAVRHVEEEIAGGRSGRLSVERTIEEMNTRSGYMHEATLRLEQESSRLAAAVDKLEKSDENLTDRMTLFLEQLRRVLERLDKMEAFAEFPDEAREAFQKAAYDRELLVQRLGIVERLVNDMADRTEEFAQTLTKVDQKSQQNTGELLAMAERMQDLTDQTKLGLKKMYQVLLRQRRRASEALNQEIKEFTHGELHAGD
jgi:chromosome segregation ATPase